jgi:hypothetical protein
MARGHGWGGASQRVFQPPGAGLAPALPLLISGGEFLAYTYDATYIRTRNRTGQCLLARLMHHVLDKVAD